MSYYAKCQVNDGDEFYSENYPRLLSDLIRLKKETAGIPDDFKAEILVSFTKYHSLKNEWIKANPEFTKLIATGSLPLKDMEALFEASARNPLFRQQLENFLTSSIREPANEPAILQIT